MWGKIDDPEQWGEVKTEVGGWCVGQGLGPL